MLPILAVFLQHGLDCRRRYFNLHAGAFFLQQHGDPRIAVSPAAVQCFGHVGMGEIGDAHWHTQFTAEIGGQSDILQRQFQREIRRVETALQELPAQPVEGALAAQ